MSAMPERLMNALPGSSLYVPRATRPRGGERGAAARGRAMGDAEKAKVVAVERACSREAVELGRGGVMGVRDDDGREKK
jgi:hypothetical protein